MAEFTDASAIYIVMIVGAIAGAAGLGWYMAEQVSTAVIAILFMLGGYLDGLYISSSGAEITGFSVFTGVVAAAFAYFLPIALHVGVALFALGLLLGVRTDRRG